MKSALSLLIQLGGIIALLSFIGAFAAHIQLQFCIDRKRVKQETGHDGRAIIGSVLAPVEFYKEEARLIWSIRDKGLKAFAISIGVIALLAVAAAVLDVPLK